MNPRRLGLALLLPLLVLAVASSADAQCATILSENFDGVTAPALPAGWVTAFTNGDGDCTVGGPLCTLGTNWTTSNSGADTAPNTGFHNDPSCVTDNRLDVPTFAIPAATTSTITFRNNFNTESTFDGGVLEISIGGGPFTDIVTAGGSFTAGAYNGTISVNFLSPIAGRQAWTGNSGGFVTTTANLPAGAAGQNVQFRFRMASDCSVGSTAWLVDTLSVSACGTGCALGVVCPGTQDVVAPPGAQSTTVTFPDPTITGSCANATVSCVPASGDPFPLGTTTVNCTASAPGATNATCAFDVNVTTGVIQQIPTVSGLGLAGLALLLAGAGFLALRRRA
jgi:hypothetical protein